MIHKRSRTIQEKIKECLDKKVCNLHPELYQKLSNDLLNVPEAINVAKCKSYVSKLLSIPEMGMGTKHYWSSRGWSDGESYVKSREYSTTYSKKVSAYSIEFWTRKINPNTGINYTIIEAEYERNSRRPIRKEYWMKLGYNENDAEIKAKEFKNKNNKRGSIKSKANVEIKKYTSKRCKEYWTSRGYNELEAKEKVSEEQATFTLEKCIEKYGEEKGRERWLSRQEKWHNSYKKSNFSKISQKLFWNITEYIEDLNDIYFAELGPDKKKDDTGKNNEMRLKLDRILLPDFIDVKNKKIIEFDGTYWHGEVGRGNKSRDLDKISIYQKNGYSVFRVSENDFKNKPKEVIEQCINFLSQ